MKTIILCCAIVLTAVLGTGCRTMVETQPTTVTTVRTVSPGANYIWIDGEWYSRGGHYYQRPGYWGYRSNRTWAPGHWQSTRRGWYYRKGHWR